MKLNHILLFSILLLCTNCSLGDDKFAPKESQSEEIYNLPFVETKPIEPEATSDQNLVIHEKSTQECFLEINEIPPTVRGMFVLSGNYYLYNNGIEEYNYPSFILIPKTKEKIDLFIDSSKDANGADFLVSNEYTELIVFINNDEAEGNLGEVKIFDNRGMLHRKYQVRDWWNLLNWIDDDRILVVKISDDNPFPVALVSTSDGKVIKEIESNYSKIFNSSRELSTWGKNVLNRTIYSNNFQYVIYPQTPDKFVLYKPNTNTIVTEIVNLGTSTRAPLWLHNNKEFIVDLAHKAANSSGFSDELFVIGINGEKRQLSNFETLGFSNVDILNYSESFDGHFIASWFFDGELLLPRLSIIDTLSGETKTICFNDGGYTPAVRSPNSHQLLVDGSYDSFADYGTLFIDLDNNMISQVAKDVIPVGWMVDPFLK